MSKIRIGVTGQQGFLGGHLSRQIELLEKYELVHFKRNFFNSETLLDGFVSSVDVIVHLAAMNRHEDSNVIYETNLDLTKRLIGSLNRVGSSAYVLFSSSTQETQDNLYGRSKKECSILLKQWASKSNGSFTSFIIPNVFGPFGKPYYNSVVSTFCHQLINGESATINGNSQIELIYVGEVVSNILWSINSRTKESDYDEVVELNSIYSIGVSDLYQLLSIFRKDYFDSGIIPELRNSFEINLFNTFRSFIQHSTYFPRPYVQHCDDRGSFIELIKLNSGGQVSYSTTVPGITRGNHFHTRKIERFSVISGSAKIELRKVDSEEVITLMLDGENPSYVDMPIWYTHNITNIGDGELLTVFWINEFYNQEDSDTYFNEV